MRGWSNRKAKLLGLTVALLAVPFAAVSCGGSHSGMDMGGSGPANEIPAGALYNAADVEFVQGMIIHHRQAVQMADMAFTNSTNPAVLELAQEIKSGQELELSQMEGWLVEWGQPIPGPAESHDGMDHGGMPMDGMVSDERMAEMAQADGPAFDALFLESMIEHHQGAVDMAEYVLANGLYPPLADLADEIIRVQESEIAEMGRLLTSTNG